MKLQHKTETASNYGFIIIISLCLLISCNNKEELPKEVTSTDDTTTVNKLLLIENPNTPNNPKLAISYNQQAIELSKKIGYKKGQLNGVLNLGRIHLNLNNYKNADSLFSIALDYAESESMNEFIPTCLGCLGMVHEELYNYAESLDYYSRSKAAFMNIGDTIGIIKCHINISNIYKDIGDRAKAMKSILKGLEIAEKTNDEYQIGICLNNLSILYQESGKNDIAIPYFFRFAEICLETGDSLGLARAYNNIGVSYYDLSNNNLAFEYFLKSIEIRKKLNNRIGLASSFLNMGNLMMDKKDYSSAINYYKDALKISNDHKNYLLISKLSKIIGDVFVNLNNYDSALYYFNESLAIAENYEMNERTFAVLTGITDLYEKIGDYEKAFKYSQATMALNDTILHLHNTDVIEELKTRYETDKKEQEIIKLNEEKDYAKQIRILLFSFSGLLFFLATYIFFSQRLKIRKNKQISNYQQSLIERKLTISTLEQKNLEQNLQHSEKELVNMALYFVQKIEFVEKLKNEIRLMQKDSSYAKEAFAKKVTLLINDNIRLDKEHVEFQLHLENVNQLFYQKLKEDFPNLTQNELKLSALLRCDFSSKDIATIFNISPSSVDMNRYRLRKKFKLTTEENIGAFLKSL